MPLKPSSRAETPTKVGLLLAHTGDILAGCPSCRNNDLYGCQREMKPGSLGARSSP